MRSQMPLLMPPPPSGREKKLLVVTVFHIDLVMTLVKESAQGVRGFVSRPFKKNGKKKFMSCALLQSLRNGFFFGI